MDIKDLLGPIPDTSRSLLAHRLKAPIKPSSLFVWGFRMLRSCFWFGAAVLVFYVCGYLFGQVSGFVVAFGLVALVAWAFQGFLQGFELSLAWKWWLRRNYPPPLAEAFQDWDQLTQRLRDSLHETRWQGVLVRECDHIFLGVVDGTVWPVLGWIPKLQTHVHVVGPSNSGKTHRFIVPAATQMIRRRRSTIVIVDLKGDRGCFFKVATETARSGLDFRWGSLEADKSSYLYLPFYQRFCQRLSLSAQVQILSQAMSLESSDRHDDVFFSDLNEKNFRKGFMKWKPRSFRDLKRGFEREGAAEDLGLSKREFELGAHVRASIDRLALPLFLNGCQPGQGVTAEAIAASIQMDDLLSRPQVVYFWLPATLERVTARIVARLVFHQIAAAARVHEGPRVPVYLLFDEFQEVVGDDTDTLLKQCRDKQISVWMAHQQLEDLCRGRSNHLAAVTGNVGMQIHFGAQDTRGREHLIHGSGETLRTLRAVSTLADGRLSRQSREVVTPRLTAEDIVYLNSDPALAAVYMSPSTPLAPFNHVFLMRTGFCMSHAAARSLAERRWPAGNRFTVANALTEELADERPQTAPRPAAPPNVRPPQAAPNDQVPPAEGPARQAANTSQANGDGETTPSASDPLEEYLKRLRDKDQQEQ